MSETSEVQWQPAILRAFHGADEGRKELSFIRAMIKPGEAPPHILEFYRRENKCESLNFFIVHEQYRGAASDMMWVCEHEILTD
jgi:hypothetical protein